MPATKQEAERVFHIVNGYMRANLKFFACDNDAECTPILVCGEYHRPGRFETTKTPKAWHVGNMIAVNLSGLRDFKDGGDHELAFIIGHELAHHTVFPPGGIAWYVYWNIIQNSLPRPHLHEAYRCHMDFIVNEYMYRNKDFVRHLRNNGLDLYKGAYLLYIEHNSEPPNDWSMRAGILKYNHVAIWRETDPARFNAFTPRPTFDAISNFCTEFLTADWKHWTADKWFEYTARTLILTAELML